MAGACKRGGGGGGGGGDPAIPPGAPQPPGLGVAQLHACRVPQGAPFEGARCCVILDAAEGASATTFNSYCNKHRINPPATPEPPHNFIHTTSHCCSTQPSSWLNLTI
jgi:hypothetical protein